MGSQPLRIMGGDEVRESLAGKLKTARSLAELSTRSVAAKLAGRHPISHATIANYESGRSVPPLDVLAGLAELYGRPINWFLERGKGLTGVQYRNLKSRVRTSDLHRFEAEVQRWIDGYVALETRLGSPLIPSVDVFQAGDLTPVELGLKVRRHLGLTGEDEPIPSVVEVLEKFGIRVLENPTDLRIDGMAAKYGDEYVVVLNPKVPHDRTRLSAAHELAHVLYGDCEAEGPGTNKATETRAFEFASHLLLSNKQLIRAFEGRSMVRLVQFKERFGISLAAMVYRAEKQGFISKQVAKSLWIAFAERGWKTNEPGTVRQDRATRFELLIEQAIDNGKLSMKEVSDLCGVKPDAIRERLDYAMGIRREPAPGDEGANMIQFPE